MTTSGSGAPPPRDPGTATARAESAEDRLLATCRTWFGRALESPAYRRFCQLHLGGAWGQLSPCTRPQLDALMALCPSGPEARVLDLGCGSGGLATLLAQRLGCRATGFDRVTPPRPERTALESRCSFEAADLTTLELEPESADAVLLVDVLALLPEPRSLLRRWARWLVPGGRLVVLGHSLSDPGRPPRNRSEVAHWLEEIGLEVSEIDFDRFERRFWHRQCELVETLAQEFADSEDRPLRRLLSAEARQIRPWADEGRSHRRLTVGLGKGE